LTGSLDIENRTRPKAERIAALDSLGGAGLPPKPVFKVLHDESDDLEVRQAALRAVARSAGAINQLVRRFRPPSLRERAVAELERIATRPLPGYAEQRIGEDLAAVRADPLGPRLANLGLADGRDRRVLAAGREALADARPAVRSMAIGLLASLGEINDVIALAADPATGVRSQLAEMLGYFSTGRAEDVATLERLAADPEAEVTVKARAALRRLGARELPTRSRPSAARAGNAAWLDLLAKLAAKILADRDRAADLPESALETGWLGTPGATEDELTALEERLSLKLPPSYRSFLQTTNGWGPTSFAVDRLMAAHEVVRFADSEPEWVAIWAENEEGPALRTAVQVSTVADGVCLLIPSGSSEWETWFFASWIPGAHRHASFRAFMESELQRD
jgi:hypothetical protein